ncbi:hypothetical protein PCASD_01470 [Puccinia coronata f. sp. avenae]|uniref:Uncharacterized protein n=1 Tax=Puccinia coronata f. sp. avenae TaxID=200324 RepID=A0A2N5VKC1_9BASI|nr:hypothetical protein PCASD_01470 [Puccinia coronata f. sp. avenae]
MSTRSNKPELAGLLPAPTRSKRSSSAGGKSQQPEAADDHEERNSASSPSAGSHGLGSPSLNLLGQYPDTPQIAGYTGPQQRREDQALGERAHIALEPIRGSPDQRSYRGTQGLIEQRPRDAEITSEIDSQKEVEEYVKGWNPWKVKAEIFPSPKGKGKKRSSSSQEMRGHYNNPQKWKQLTSLGKTLMSAYNSM